MQPSLDAKFDLSKLNQDLQEVFKDLDDEDPIIDLKEQVPSVAE